MFQWISEVINFLNLVLFQYKLQKLQNTRSLTLHSFLLSFFPNSPFLPSLLQLLLRKKAAEELKKEQERKSAERRKIIDQRCGQPKNLDGANEGEPGGGRARRDVSLEGNEGKKLVNLKK